MAHDGARHSHWSKRAATMGKSKRALLAARRAWVVVRGPAGAREATAARMGGTVIDAAVAFTDMGKQVFYRRDSPKMVKELVR